MLGNKEMPSNISSVSAAPLELLYSNGLNPLTPGGPFFGYVQVAILFFVVLFGEGRIVFLVVHFSSDQ